MVVDESDDSTHYSLIAFYLSLYAEPRDELVLVALGGIINHALCGSSLYHFNSFAYRNY